MSKKNTAPAKRPAAKKPAAKSQQTAASKLDVKEIVKVAGILTAICVVISALLAGANLLTKERIAQIALENEYAACETVFPSAGRELEFTSFAEIASGSDVSGYLATDDGKAVGCVIITSAKGYGGDVQVMVGFDMNRTVTGVSVLSHSETPGLGANAANPGFLDQFVSSADAGSLAVAKDGGTIDAVTAATISSRAVTKAVNMAAEQFEQLMAAGQLRLPDAAPVVSVGDVSASDASGSDVTPSDAENQQGGAQ
ncbi:MAG: RnfABCDGE type electron transport complex subunit G [Ruminococcaceae bacterium]|nr:RnfABCDGE type electron transport complex subunit G [Oscillospiraceae bacterium]